MIESESTSPHYESHRGFNAKARQILLEPLAPFIVSEKRINAGSSSNPCSPVAPHRGFNSKAREVLICRNALPLHPFKFNLMSTKSSSDFDLRRRLLHSGGCILPKHGSDNITYKGSTKSTATIATITDSASTPFDEIGDYPHSKVSKVKAHLLLGDIGKARSVSEFFVKPRKQVPLRRTFQQNNVMKLPSVDSDMDNVSQLRQIFNRNDSEESTKELSSDVDILNLRRTQYEIKQEGETATPK